MNLTDSLRAIIKECAKWGDKWSFVHMNKAVNDLWVDLRTLDRAARRNRQEVQKSLEGWLVDVYKALGRDANDVDICVPVGVRESADDRIVEVLHTIRDIGEDTGLFRVTHIDELGPKCYHMETLNDRIILLTTISAHRPVIDGILLWAKRNRFRVMAVLTLINMGNDATKYETRFGEVTMSYPFFYWCRVFTVYTTEGRSVEALFYCQEKGEGRHI